MPTYAGTGRGVGGYMSTQTNFLRQGTRVIVVFGKYAGMTGTIESNTLEKVQSAEYTPAFRVQLDNGKYVTLRTDQVAQH